MQDATRKGALMVVGVGMKLGSQCSPEARAWIARADIVFTLMGNPIGELWVKKIHPNVVSLQPFYRDAPSRPAAYVAMVDQIMAALEEEKAVCVVFYGHPGVFVWPSHAAIERARAAGFEARMAPAISAEDCLFADLGVDPAEFGCQSYEARDFFVHRRAFDPTASLVLWQIAVVGDGSFTAFKAEPGWLAALALALMEHYPSDHVVIVYEAATLPVTTPRIERVMLRDLGEVCVSQSSSLYVPPLGAPSPCGERLALLESYAKPLNAGAAETSPR